MKTENTIRTEIKSHSIRVNINCEIDINKCLFTKNGNIKLGKMWVFSKLYSDEIFYIRDYDIQVQGTCCGCCDGCKNACYVKRSYRYGSVIKAHAVRTLAMRYGQDTLFESLNKQLKRARKKPTCVRIDQSGEIETTGELKNWIELSRENPETKFYLYTKRYDILEKVLKEYGETNIPNNFTVNVSIWHNFGIACYKRIKHFSCVKAFVYDDGFDYASKGIDIQTTCKAYDNGKLNHNITCDICGKCFDRRPEHKVIGCKAH